LEEDEDDEVDANLQDEGNMKLKVKRPFEKISNEEELKGMEGTSKRKKI